METIRKARCPIAEDEIDETDCRTCPPPRPANCPYREKLSSQKKKTTSLPIRISKDYLESYRARGHKRHPFDLFTIEEEDLLKHEITEACLKEMGLNNEELSKLNEYRIETLGKKKRKIIPIRENIARKNEIYEYIEERARPQIEKMRKENERKREARFREIESIVKLPPDPKFREELTNAAIWYLAYKENMENSPTIAQRRTALEKIGRLAQDFANVLRNLDDKVRLDLARLESEQVWGKLDAAIGKQFEKIPMWETIDRAEEDASRIHRAALAAGKRLQLDKTTKRSNVALRECIKRLTSAYENATRKKINSCSPNHKFFGFVRLFLDYIAPNSIKDEALSKSIRRALDLP